MSNLWGSEAWSFLHNITFNYPLKPNSNDKKNYYIFFKSIDNILPCSECKKHYSILFEYIDIKIFLVDRYSLIWWLFIIHNLINKRLNKQLYKFEKLIDKYYLFNQKNTCSKCSNNIDNVQTNINKYIKDKYYEITKKMIVKYNNREDC